MFIASSSFLSERTFYLAWLSTWYTKSINLSYSLSILLWLANLSIMEESSWEFDTWMLSAQGSFLSGLDLDDFKPLPGMMPCALISASYSVTAWFEGLIAWLA